jgi:hypothetical protein
MTLPNSPSLNATGGHDGPTTCDSNKVKENGKLRNTNSGTTATPGTNAATLSLRHDLERDSM